MVDADQKNDMLSPFGRAVVETTRQSFGVSRTLTPARSYVPPDYDVESLGIGACGFHPVFGEVQ